MSFTKILYLAIFSIIFLLIFIVNGCSYPTNYKAFVPKALDSDYKEYQRLCKEEIGKVIYARPVGEGVKLENLSGIPLFGFPLNNAIKLNAIGVRDKSDKNKDKIIGIYLPYKYYNSWVTPSLSMHQDVKQHIQCYPFKNWDGKYAIIEKKAFENKETIGDEMIIKELDKINHMDYASYQKYISQVFKDAVYSKKRNP